jgi:hypothetical protein
MTTASSDAQAAPAGQQVAHRAADEIPQSAGA